MKKIVLAFSGGLDTSFCVPYLVEQGFEVHTIFINTGGTSLEEQKKITKRAIELGAIKHVNKNIDKPLWKEIIKPLIWSGSLYQDRYPALCSDRYLIVKETVALCKKLKTKNIAHGCTGMGNDQVRFDLSIQALGNFKTITKPLGILKPSPQLEKSKILPKMLESMRKNILSKEAIKYHL